MVKGPVFDADHYSYAAYADPAMAASFDAKRFGGPIGRILLEDQERVLAQFLGDVTGRRVLDIGDRHRTRGSGAGQTRRCCHGRRRVQEMLAVARTRAAEARLPVEFAEGDAHALAYPDRSFDAVGVPAHADARSRLAEGGFGALPGQPRDGSCSTTRLSSSIASLQALWRRIASAMGSNVEAYRVFSAADIARELDRHGVPHRLRSQAVRPPDCASQVHRFCRA